MKRIFIVVIPVLFILLACGLFPSTATPTAVATSTNTITAILPTATVLPTSTPNATIAVTAPQQWTGTLRDVDGTSRVISLIINKINGTAFTGNMYWAPVRGYSLVITAAHGDIITNIDTATEQNRWGFLPDFKSGNKGGIWLRWTETANVKGCCVIMNGWYYAHIQSNGHLAGIFFRNDKVANPDNASYDLTVDVTPTPTP